MRLAFDELDPIASTKVQNYKIKLFQEYKNNKADKTLEMVVLSSTPSDTSGTSIFRMQIDLPRATFDGDIRRQ